MFNRFVRLLALLLTCLLSGLGLGLTPMTASAGTTPQSCVNVDMTKGSGHCADIVSSESKSASSSSVSSNMTSVDGIKIGSSTTVVSYIQAKGATKAQMTGKVYKLKKSMSLWTSYYDVHHREVWHWKKYGKGHKFYYSSKDKWYHDGACWNKVKVPSEKKAIGHKVSGKIKIVKEFHFTGAATAKVDDYVTTQAKAWVNTFTSTGETYCYAYGEGKARAAYAASAFANIDGKVYVSLEAAVSGVVKGANSSLSAKLKGRTTVQIRADLLVQAYGSATATASAKAKCSEAPPPPPPVIEKPVIVDVTQINDVDVNGTTRMCATISLPGSDSGMLIFTARYGSASPRTFDVSGQDEKCTTYTAPTEVPDGGTDTITVSVRDYKTGLSATDSTTFKVNVTPQPRG